MSNPKAHLLFVEANIDLIGLIWQLNKTKANIITLSLPQRSLVGSQLITLKLLARKLAASNKEVTIVSPDPITINLARLAGLTVGTATATEGEVVAATSEVADPAPAPSLPTPPARPAWMTFERKILAVEEEPSEAEVAEELPVVSSRPPLWANWKMPRLAVQLPKFQFTRQHQIALALGAVGIALLGAVLALLLPQASVVLEVPSEVYQRQFTLTLADEQDLQAAGHNILTGRFIEISNEQVVTFTATGQENQGDKARGQINIVNYTSGIQGILANTRFQSPTGLIFRIQNEILVPPARGNIAGRAVVDAIADSGGANYNLAAPTKLTIPGLGATGTDLVYGEVVGTFTGGTDNVVGVVSQEDIDQAKQEAAKTLFSTSQNELTRLLKRTEMIDPTFIQNDIINAIPSVAAGAKQDQFEVRVQSRSWTIALPKNSFPQAIANAASFEVAAGQQVTDRTLAGATVEPIEANFLTHRIDLLVKLDGRVGPRFDREAMRRAMTYRPLAEVEAELKSEPSLTTAAITLWPSFLTRLPLLPDSIDLDIIYLGE